MEPELRDVDQGKPGRDHAEDCSTDDDAADGSAASVDTDSTNNYRREHDDFVAGGDGGVDRAVAGSPQHSSQPAEQSRDGEGGKDPTLRRDAHLLGREGVASDGEKGTAGEGVADEDVGGNRDDEGVYDQAGNPEQGPGCKVPVSTGKALRRDLVAACKNSVNASVDIQGPEKSP